MNHSTLLHESSTQESYILEALEIVTSWDLPEEDLAEAVNAQAGLMAGPDPEYPGNRTYWDF